MRCLAVLALVVTLSSAAPIAPTEPLDALWARFGRAKPPEKGDVDVLDDHLGPALWEDAHARRPLSFSVQRVAKEHRLDPETAAALVEATIVTQFLPDDDAEPDTALLQRISSAFWRAYRRAPASSIVLSQAGWILFELEHHADQEQRVRDEIDRSTDPAPLAARLASTGLCSEETRRSAIRSALDRRPLDPALELAAAGLSERDPCQSAAWTRKALEDAAAARVSDPAFLSIARNALLSSLLQAGLVSEALDALRAIPVAERKAALDADPARTEGSLGGVEYRAPMVALRSSLASAAFLMDDRDLARALAAGKPAAAESHDPEIERLELVRSAIARLSTDAGDDAFDILDRAIVIKDSGFGYGLDSFSELIGRVAVASGYPEMVREFAPAQRPALEAPDDPPACLAAAVQACRASMAGRSGEAVASPAPDPSSLVMRRLAAPPLVVYSEHALPEGVVPWEPTERESETQEKSLEKMKVPDIWPVRVERTGAAVVAIGLSQDYDPGGEVSGGGYWIVRSEDGGNTWGRKVYAGLRPMQPYVVRSFSHLPLGTGDRLRIEVDIRELNTERITFPPIDRAFKREQTRLFLEVAWADLERDTDGDGLTDLAEERLMTDPAAVDSDGDGLPDGSDPLPHIAATRTSSARATALVAVLRTAGDESAQGIFPADPGGQGPASPSLEQTMASMLSGAPRLTSEATMFVQGDPGDFAAVSPGRRTIVLTAEEAARARERFGPHYPGELRLYVDHAGTRALAIWDERWRGMTVRLKNQRGTWVPTVLGSWIT
jgi:hypothetical protein